ncbi:hypothetical protein RRF57_008798 [Xylaria bambusicola]|uniref:Uncharacterized protein n=1 Tax=Xylaria bambusicola TaxID=326684 RepID=A0AAN7USN8_9PEZI
MYRSAPSFSTSSLLELFLEIPTTFSAPIALAKRTAKCPSPPTPTMPTLLPGPHPNRLKGEYTVTPPHNIGAASAELSPSGM